MSEEFANQLAAARRGDRGAADALFAEVRPLLELQARALMPRGLSARVSAADVVQESLKQAFTDLEDFRGNSKGEWISWLRRLAAGHAAKSVRFHAAEKRNADRDVAITETPAAPSSSDAVRRVIKAEEAATVAQAIEQLPTQMQDVVARRVIHRQSWDEIAAEVGKSSGAARVMWTRAIKRLRETLTGIDDNSK